MRSTPPCSTSMSMRVLPASIEFSSSSFTTEAGRSMTSPAAILVTTLDGSWRIFGIRGNFTILINSVLGRQLAYILACALTALCLVRSNSQLFQLPFQRAGGHAELGGGGGDVAAGFGHRRTNLLLKLRILHHA